MRATLVMRSFFFVFLILILFAGPTRHAYAQDDSSDRVVFKWAFIHRSADGQKEVIDFEKRQKVTSGDKLQIYLGPMSEAYLYLFLYDAHKDLYLLFPESPDYYERKSLEKEDIYVPGEHEWFEWDTSKGTERFYLLASSTRLTELEEKTARYLANNQDSKLKSQLYDEIATLRKQKSNLTTTSEKPVAIAGTIRTRGADSELLGDATLVEAEEFYGKTLRLRHE
jgi:hypothetical protein